MSRSEKISWQVLIDFFNEKIKQAPETYNSAEFQYPQKVTNQTLRNNSNKIRFHLLSHYISSNFDVDLSNKYVSRELIRVSDYLKKPTLARAFNLDACEGPSQDVSMSSQDISMSSQDISFGQCSLSPRKKRKRALTDEDFVPEDDSDDENVCPFSKCETERNNFKLEIEKLKQENSLLKEENTKLRAEKTPVELESYDKVWPKICLKSQCDGLSYRQLKKTFKFLKSEVKVLNNIVVPSNYFLHDQRHMIPTLTKLQKEQFVANAKELTIGVDGTSFKLQKFMAVLLFDEKNDYIVYDIEQYNGGTADILTKVIEDILGGHKELIYSKTVSLLSDTESATKKSCQQIIKNIMEGERIVPSVPFWAACAMHSTSNSEAYGFELLSSSTKTVINNISKICGPSGNKYSQNNISINLKLSRSQENKSEIKILPEKGNRFYFKTNNSRNMFDHADWLIEFFKNTHETDRHNKNDQLQSVIQHLSKEKTKILLECGLYTCFWVYFIRPLWSYFSMPVKAKEAQSVLRNVIKFLSDSKSLNEPIIHLTQAEKIFEGIDSFIKPPTDENVNFSETFMSILGKKVFQGSKISDNIFSNLEDITRKFLTKIHWKYTKEYTHFCDKKLEPEEEVRVILFSNQTTESVFGHLKNNLINPNTTHIQLIHRTCLVFNDTLNWALNADNSDAIFAQATKDRKKNKANSKSAALEHDEELFSYLYQKSKASNK